MTSSSTANGSPLANQSAAENSVKSIAPVVASTQGESSKPSLVKGPTSAYIGVNKLVPYILSFILAANYEQ